MTGAGKNNQRNQDTQFHLNTKLLLDSEMD